MSAPLYLDHNATTPCSPAAAEAMAPYHTEIFGNALTSHAFGVPARAALERARGQVAALIGASPAEIVFTAGGTEALNLAVKGLAFAALRGGPRRIVVSATEHHAVEDSAHWLSALGFETVVLPVDGQGRVDPDDVRRTLLGGGVLLVAVMHANNEVGTVQPVEEIGALCREVGVPFLCDVVQSIGKLGVEVASIGADLLALSGHKFYGPKGVGALYVRSGLQLTSLMHGASHEQGRRAGTHNVPGAVGMGVAADEAAGRLTQGEAQRLAQLRDQLEQALLERIPGAVVNGGGAPRLPNTSNLSFDGVLAQDLLVALGTRGVAASAGAACRDGVPVPSPTLMAMGLGHARALGGVRLSIGRHTDPVGIDRAVRALVEGVAELRA